MRLIVCVLATCAAALALVFQIVWAAPASANAPAVTLTARQTGQAWWMGARHIPISVAIHNGTAHPIKFANPSAVVNPDSVVNVTLTDAMGRSPQRMIADIVRADANSVSWVHVAAGDSFVIDLDKAGVSDEYEMLPSGRYTLRIELTYTDGLGHGRTVSTTMPAIEVRDVRDFAVSSIAVVTPDSSADPALIDPGSSAHSAVVSAPDGAYWLAYWIERAPVVTDVQTPASGATNSPPPVRTRNWVTTLYWLGRVARDTDFQVGRKAHNDLVVRFTDVNGVVREVEIDHFWAYPKYIKPVGGPIQDQQQIEL